MQEETVHSRRIEDTWSLARALLAEYPGRAVFALHGELGSGKTCFVQGLALALDIRRPVTSPTFIIINEYEGSRPLTHIDLYRLAQADEALAIGLEDYLDTENGVTAVEWAERADDLIPPDAIHLSFTTLSASEARSIVIRRPAVGRPLQTARRTG